MHISSLSFLLNEVIPKMVPLGYIFPCHNALNKDIPLFFYPIQSSPHKFTGSNNLSNNTKFIPHLSYLGKIGGNTFSLGHFIALLFLPQYHFQIFIGTLV
jgi:hypothetical protein